MTKNYILTDDAAHDLRGVIRYTRKTWGAAQARQYAETLEKGIIRLAGNPLHFRDMSELYPMLRMARCEHHYVFCLPQEDAPVLIVAILHERMDLMTRLADRLNGPEA
ncbi:type II toxin-antitoxin system RelE/ParE family toxin [Paracoccus sp. YIM 132242]|uniref:Type II toxin-antitoxin system RelE/ParE family toxin n=1 Tax=Paracoccus lichenicola TaxID=2665644 RepID=A0A6L6HVP1_9RHOB|nr:type II toxin-antitoxin system RelE/ParE family toxin [Paracoccus lichenicola]MTE02085.1 type II toxin-antitoxin system RelE/ParE family toxin [Paracoccus lichenicola]